MKERHSSMLRHNNCPFWNRFSHIFSANDALLIAFCFIQLSSWASLVESYSIPPASSPSTVEENCSHSTSQSNINTNDSCSGSNNGSADGLGLDIPRMKQMISQGQVYQQSHFLSEEEVAWLVDDMGRLEGMFQPSGLSDTRRGGQQGFDKRRDRVTCPAPWWKATSPSPNTSKDQQEDSTLSNIQNRIHSLRANLSRELDRPTMYLSSAEEEEAMAIAHECYYSQSRAGAVLPLHMDERHEEIKGARGWLLPSRRSISWLVYLSDDPNWTLSENGGALRTYPQPSITSSSGCDNQNNGNLQIGNLIPSSSSSSSSIPVYLDCWFPVKGETDPFSILYIIDDKDKNNTAKYITRPWNSHLEAPDVLIQDFIKEKALKDNIARNNGNHLFLNKSFASSFHLLEDRESWSKGNTPYGSIIKDIVPERGSLVMFDSVSVPHEVLEVKRGTRAALAGWFHEQTQPFPENIYDS